MSDDVRRAIRESKGKIHRASKKHSARDSAAGKRQRDSPAGRRLAALRAKKGLKD